MEPWQAVLGGALMVGSLVLAMWGINGDHGRYSHIAFALGSVWIVGFFAALFFIATLGAFGVFR